MSTTHGRSRSSLYLAMLGIYLFSTLAAADGSDNLQRSEEIYTYTTLAKSGERRGLDLYFHKCWYCHNDHAITAGTGGPTLKTIYKKPKLVSGDIVSDENLAKKIRDGGPGMPAFRYDLSDSDVIDLLSYLRSDDCCYMGEEPPFNPKYRASTKTGRLEAGQNVEGGPLGTVVSESGEALEGIMVQLISEQNAIRTTVYSDFVGSYEFPKLPEGLYTLRIARPMEFQPFLRKGVYINGDTHLEDIVLKRVSSVNGFEYSELLPPTDEIAAQLTGAEWLLNLPGTGQEKRAFSNACGFACHSYQQIFRTRFDKHGWRLLVQRATRHVGAPLIMPSNDRRMITGGDEEEEIIINWLARIRGPKSENAPFKALPGPRGESTKVVVTEYEIPRLLLALHDVAGDSKGNIWYTSHRSPYIGKLDPVTGIVIEYRVPSTPGALSGTHAIWIDDSDVVWLSEVWTHKLTSFNPNTNQFKQHALDVSVPKNFPGFGNFGLSPKDGTIWHTIGPAVAKIDQYSGKILQRYPLDRIFFTYDNLISKDGRYWVGGQWPGNLIGVLDIETGKLDEYETRSKMSSPAKGAFDWENNAWFGGRGGQIIKFDVNSRRSQEYFPPTPYVNFYEVMPDKRGQVWAGAQHGGRFIRFDPKSDHWTEYVLPEPFSHNRRTWIDHSTTPVTVWYADHNGYIVRLQPLR